MSKCELDYLLMELDGPELTELARTVCGQMATKCGRDLGNMICLIMF